MKSYEASSSDSNKISMDSVAHALIDHNLNLITHNHSFGYWFDLDSDSSDISLLTILPELNSTQETLQVLGVNKSTYTLTGLSRYQQGQPIRYFDLHIEPNITDDNLLSVFLIDKTKQVILKQQLESRAQGLLIDAALEWDDLAGFDNALFLLNKASQVLIATLNVEDILQRLLQVANQLIGAEGSSVWLWDETKYGYLVCRAVFDSSKKPLLNYKLKPGQGIAGWVAQNGQSAIVREVIQDDRFTPEIDSAVGFKTYSLLAVPMWLRGRILGVLEIVNKVSGHFNVADQILAETLAASASIALDNARLVEELQHQKIDLQYRNEDLDAFAHTVAHDLQNPLTGILGFSDLLIREGHRIDHDKQIEILHVLHRSVEKVRDIVRELLLLATVSKTEVEVAPLDMRLIMFAALDRVDHLLQDRESQISLPDNWPVALGHAPWVEELWENYLSNAIKYGGNPLRIEAGGTIEADNQIRFWVRDNGKGLSDEDQARLFEPFTKLDGWAAGGHGLGLSIVRRITEKLNGSVRVDSELGKGSEFSFTLPAAPE